MIRFGIVGTGWRSRFFVRIAHELPDLFEVVGVVTRDVERAKQWAQPYDIPLVTSVENLLAQKPLYVVTSLPRRINFEVLTTLAEKGVPALSETPPGNTIEEMEALFRLVQNGAKIAVVEQYHLQPNHAARIAFAHSGKLGTISQVQISAAHGYHGISLMRRFLDIMYEDVTITARRFISPIVRGPDREGLPNNEEIKDSEQILAWFNFGSKLGVLDFTSDQYRSFIRQQRILVRGERGEIVNDHAAYLQDHQTPIELDFTRHRIGDAGFMRERYLFGIQIGEEWIYKYPFAPANLHEDDIAIAHCMVKMADYVDGQDPFYSLAEACQDRYLHILMDQAVEHGQPVTSTRQIWTS